MSFFSKRNYKINNKMIAISMMEKFKFYIGNNEKSHIMEDDGVINDWTLLTTTTTTTMMIVMVMTMLNACVIFMVCYDHDCPVTKTDFPLKNLHFKNQSLLFYL